jgi:hypothetical protein
LPHILRTLGLTDEIAAELTVRVGFDRDLAAEATGTSNRTRIPLAQVHPSLERVLGPAWTTPPPPGCWNSTDLRPHCERPADAGWLR